MTALLRLLFLVPLGFIGACLAAAAMLTFGRFGWSADPGLLVFAWGAFAVATVTVGALAFVPAVVAVILAEAFGWRSILLWLAFGGGLGWIAFDGLSRFARLRPELDGATPFLAAGFVGGFVYWLIAGRFSGGPRPISSASGPA